MEHVFNLKNFATPKNKHDSQQVLIKWSQKTCLYV